MTAGFGFLLSQHVVCQVHTLYKPTKIQDIIIFTAEMIEMCVIEEES